MIGRLALVVLGFAAWAGVATAAPQTGPTLERVVIVQRHGVRPPTSSNQALAAYAEKPWPAWPVAAGELTPHGGDTVRLVGRTLRRAYRDGRLAPPHGCPAAGAVSVWADGADERTRRSGEILAETLSPGCAVKAAWAAPLPRDPMFNGDMSAPACRADPEAARAALLTEIGPEGVDTPATRSALKRLQAILAPTACAGGLGTCFAGENRLIAGPTGPRLAGTLATTASLAEDLLLEYAEGMPRSDVGWGRAGSAADIAAVMPLHERAFKLYFGDSYRAARDGAPMARLILAALAGETRPAAPGFGPQTRLLALAGHDSNLALMGGLFGLAWTLSDQPDATAPATALAFELWKDPTTGARFVRPVIYYATLDQLRTLTPAAAKRRVLAFTGCASGPMGSCPLETLRRRTLALIPPGCGAV
jgi:4-phytase / acid phosphatase